MQIRDETRQEHDAIREVNRLAFNGEVEGELVDRLRADGLVVASLVAVEQGRVVGHILFSKLTIEAATEPRRAVALAPMAVRPESQRKGVGSALVRRGLEVCRERGHSIVLVVGHPAYYPRFGFSAALAKNLRSPYSGDVFMALELTPGALKDVVGTVAYPEAFSEVD